MRALSSCKVRRSRVSSTTKIGWVLAGLGVIALLLGTLKFKSKQNVFSIGGFNASSTTEKTVPELYRVGAGLIVVGSLVLVVGRRKYRGR